jgi:hypothetical protein
MKPWNNRLKGVVGRIYTSDMTRTIIISLSANTQGFLTLSDVKPMIAGEVYEVIDMKTTDKPHIDIGYHTGQLWNMLKVGSLITEEKDDSKQFVIFNVGVLKDDSMVNVRYFQLLPWEWNHYQQNIS